MKICFFHENYYIGGMDTFFINLINAWPEDNDILTLACNTSHPGLEIIESKTFRKLYISQYRQHKLIELIQGQHNSKFHKFFFFRALTNIIKYIFIFPYFVFKLSVYFAKSDFDRLMVVNGGYPGSLRCQCASIAWRLSGKECGAVFNFHNYATLPNKFVIFFENFIDRLVIWSSDTFVSVSSSCLNSLKNRKAFSKNIKMDFIYNGIEDPISFNKVSSVAKKKSQEPKYCLLLATYEVRKGHIFLLKAFQYIIKDYPDVNLKIFGYGNENEIQRVRSQVKLMNLENNVSVNGYTSDANSLIANASVLVVPSQAYESFGLTIIEAMALSIPIVATDVGGIPEVIANSGAGFVCSKNNPKEFAKAIKRVLKEPSLGLRLGEAGRQSFEKRFLASRMAEAYRNLLE
jgi:glycosyltransferase involved in cell wall biosynthesis